jgi:L-galactose dehydrogenase/L-glyceraldehyde 3-phosphate reductase
MIEKRTLGRTGEEVSVLTFGCGAVGGLMVKGDAAEQERAAALALEHGVNFFDTAPGYGDGVSEINLGKLLKKLKPKALIGTKVRVGGGDRGAIGARIAASLGESLKRMDRDHVDLFQLHNVLSPDGSGETLTAAEVLGEVVPTLEKLRTAGKIRYLGFTALGDIDEIDKVVAAGVMDTAQICMNALNPSAAVPMAAGFPAQDYRRLMVRARDAGIGTICIRVLAGGALSGEMERHPRGWAVVAPIGSGSDYARDVERARSFRPLVEEGHAGSMTELAIRYALGQPSLSTTQVGVATYEQVAGAIAAIEKGPLPAAAVARVREIQQTFVGKPR